jgi:hypothetical protein
MILERRGRRPDVHDAAHVAPNATLRGDVTVGDGSHVMFGAVLTAEDGPVEHKRPVPLREMRKLARYVWNGPVSQKTSIDSSSRIDDVLRPVGASANHPADRNYGAERRLQANTG